MWAARISIITHRQQFVKRKVIQKSKSLDARICVFYQVDFWDGVWYYSGVKGRNTLGTQDFPIGLKQDFEVLEKKCKNPLTNHPSCDTIRVSRGEETLAKYNYPSLLRCGSECAKMAGLTLQKKCKKPLDKLPKL
jgi:hypothetical protein